MWNRQNSGGTDATRTAQPRHRGWAVPVLASVALATTAVVAAAPAFAGGGHGDNGKDKQVFCNVEGNSGKWKAQIGGPSTEHEYPLIIDGETVWVHDQKDVNPAWDAICGDLYGKTDVTPAAPTFTEGSGKCVDGEAKYVNPTYTVPSTEKVEYVVNGTPKDAGTYDSSFDATVKIEAQGTDDSVNVKEPNTWTHTFGPKPELNCKKPYEPSMKLGTVTCDKADIAVSDKYSVGFGAFLTSDPGKSFNDRLSFTGNPPGDFGLHLDLSGLKAGTQITVFDASQAPGAEKPTNITVNVTVPASCGSTTPPPVVNPPKPEPKPEPKPSNPTTTNNPTGFHTTS